jgi:tetrahydromethanopterin S-methyltransferase subunit G
MDPSVGNFEVLQRLTRLETKMDMIIEVKDTAHEALQSTKAAHRRLDSMEAAATSEKQLADKRAADEREALNKRLDKLDKIVFWASTTTIGAVIVGAIGLLFYLVKKGL